jgi:cyclopropane fatty-acyl-phospholipid synthase-like methyltransferase
MDRKLAETDGVAAATRRARAKAYDQAYFDRWYRRHGIGAPTEVGRAARFTLAAAEHLLMRPVRRVLDIGCGEGAWRAPLLAARPGLRYVGIDPSTYAVNRYGRTRDIALGGLGHLPQLGIRGRFDLVVCADVLPYVGDADIAAGLGWVSSRLDGVAYLHAMTADDEFFGDRAGLHKRPATTYLQLFAAHDLRRVGPHLYAGPALLPTLTALEGPLDDADVQ